MELQLKGTGSKSNERGNFARNHSRKKSQILDRLQAFFLERKHGYALAAPKKRVPIDEKNFYVDLVFFNRILSCFVLIDLKIGEIRRQDLGQMQMYVNYYDRCVKLESENPTIGIVLCKKKDDALVELTLPEDNTQIFASKYQTILPNKQEFAKLLEAKDDEENRMIGEERN